MKKKVLGILLILTIIFVGCSIKKEKFNLDDKYYDSNIYIKTTKNEIENNDGNYLLFVYTSFCSMSTPCEDIFQIFMNEYNISILSISFNEFKNTYLYKEVKYAPTVIIVKDKEVIDYLDAESDDDLDKYQNVEKFKEWLEQSIYIEKSN